MNIEDHDLVILLGDFNFRIDNEFSKVKKKKGVGGGGGYIKFIYTYVLYLFLGKWYNFEI